MFLSQFSSQPPLTQPKLLLDYVYDHESQRADQVYLTQPVGAQQVVDFTWAQTMHQARCMASHLRAQGFAPGTRIAILSQNCAYCIFAELAIWMAQCVTVSVYASESAETLRYVLEHSEARLLFVGKLERWEDQLPGVAPDLPCIAFPLAPALALQQMPSWDGIVRHTAPLTGTVHRQPDEAALLMYTSGTSGEPKGVLHSFSRATAASRGLAQHFLHGMEDYDEIRVVSYLPLAHIFERAGIECVSLIDGRLHVFFCESSATFLHDVQRARPHLFASVPRIWLKLQQGVLAKIGAARLDFLLRLPLLNRLLSRRILRELGLDQVEQAVTGSAPIAPQLLAWWRRIGLNLLEGYAMTEDFAYSHVSTALSCAQGSVGIPLPGVQVRIAPDGEILIKSPGQMLGYYRRPDLSAVVFTTDGYFHTGDRGERSSDGSLRITGRAKDLFKTSKGKYVAPAPIEIRLEQHPLVEVSLVTGVGQMAACALVQLNEPARAEMLRAGARAGLQRQLEELLGQINAQLAAHETLQMLVVLEQPWTIDNGLLTPTLKIRRHRIEALYTAHLPNWYATGQRVVWAEPPSAP